MNGKLLGHFCPMKHNKVIDNTNKIYRVSGTCSTCVLSLTFLLRILFISARALSSKVTALFGHWPTPWVLWSFSTSRRHFWILELFAELTFSLFPTEFSYSWPLQVPNIQYMLSFLRPNKCVRKVFKKYLAVILKRNFFARFLRARCRSLWRSCFSSTQSGGASVMWSSPSLEPSLIALLRPLADLRRASWWLFPFRWLRRYTSDPI